MLDLDDYRDDVLNQVNARASVEGIFTVEAFVAEAADLLTDADEIDTPDRLSFTGTGRRRQSMAVHGSQFDDNDMSVALIVGEYRGGKQTPTMTHTDAVAALRSLEAYLREAVSGDFVIEREPAEPVYQLAESLRRLHTGTGANRASRYRIFLVTDAVLSSRAKPLESIELDGVPVDFHIWDMQRFYRVHQSSQGRESLQLDLTDAPGGGVPALQVADRTADITTYLAALPGDLLAGFYRDHGSRLLEGNVRSFLTIRGKINKGIRETILKEPGHFLAFNNGISATAERVDFADGLITSVTDLQIVNGGQTTASLFYATQANRDVDLSDIFVQMKLVVVTPEDAREMVPLISRYANSQNAVREDDFFSNSPFHVRMEELSKSVLAPAQAGVNFQTKWYYERTRGQYLNERNRRTGAAQKTFDAEFRRDQVITKTDAAKYVVAWDQQPHMVSAGAQKNFMAFAKIVANSYAKQPEAFNDDYYKRLVAKAILFNAVRIGISKADWYQPGYLANLAAYAVAKLAHAIAHEQRAETFDLLRIWQQQAVGEATLAEAVAIGKLARKVLTGPDRPVVNVTEWAKRDAAWKQLADEPWKLSQDFLGECLPVKLNAAGKAAVTVSGRFPPSESELEHVRSIDKDDWHYIRSFFTNRSSLTNPDARLLAAATSSSGRMLDLEEARGLLRLYVRAINEGWQERP
jgi:hypothetical protein